jgi:hypothetical protein
VINELSMTAVRRLLFAALAALVLTACAAQSPQPESTQPAEKTYSFEPWEGDGMEIPLDGSSLEAFETSLARVKAHTSAQNYTTLINAIEYHLMYDLSAKRNRTKLAANLDGMTPQEVIDKVIWRNKSLESGNAPSSPPESVDL